MRLNILIAVTIALLFSVVFSQKAQEKSENKTLFDKLLSEDKSTRVEAYNTLLAEREKTAELLLKITKEAEEVVPYACDRGIPYLQAYNDTKSLGILLLAKYSSKSVVDFLLDNIQCGREVVNISAGNIFGGNEPPPVIVSLIEIGMPSVKAILERVEQKDLFEEQKPVEKRVKVIPTTPEGENTNKKPSYSVDYISKKELPTLYAYIIENVLGLELGAECLILEYKKAQKEGKEHKMRNLEKILRTTKFQCFSEKGSAFLKEIDKQREQEKQKQKQ